MCSSVVVCGLELSVPVGAMGVPFVSLEVAMLRGFAIICMLLKFDALRGLFSPISYWPIVVFMSGWVRGVRLWELGHSLFHNRVPVPRTVVYTHSPRVVGYVGGSLRSRPRNWAASRP